MKVYKIRRDDHSPDLEFCIHLDGFHSLASCPTLMWLPLPPQGTTCYCLNRTRRLRKNILNLGIMTALLPDRLCVQYNLIYS